MSRVALLILTVLCLLAPATGSAYCEECPFPLSHTVGDWSSEDGSYVIRIREMSRNEKQWGIAVWMIGTDETVIATGVAFGDYNTTRVDVNLTTPNGALRHLLLQVSPRNRGSLYMRTLQGHRLQPCSNPGACGRLTRQNDSPLQRDQQRNRR
ncbi:MAG: hypothetical protein NDI61_14420 [Bdellovibrionaceae bacterium]|nr:hypothetical protein [Pseudobdellovibrionaceae bacterium]